MRFLIPIPRHSIVSLVYETVILLQLETEDALKTRAHFIKFQLVRLENSFLRVDYPKKNSFLRVGFLFFCLNFFYKFDTISHLKRSFLDGVKIKEKIENKVPFFVPRFITQSSIFHTKNYITPYTIYKYLIILFSNIYIYILSYISRFVH